MKNNNPRKIGDEHVQAVFEALNMYVLNQSFDNYSNKVTKTVKYITDIYPNIQSVDYKFNHPQSDKAKDIVLILEDKSKVTINLFLIKKGGRIQPKNPGAKSFFEKYFLSKQLQEKFNHELEQKYLDFLKKIVEVKFGTHYINDKRELKRIISSNFPKFTEEINPIREQFLYELREKCHLLLKDSYNEKNEGYFYAYNSFFMTEDINIITYYGSNELDVHVDKFDPGTPSFKDIQLYKVGKNTVGIKYGEVGLTLRFKFESKPTSSIKLATSFEKIPNNLDIYNLNDRTIRQVVELIKNHSYVNTSNSSNAIGKCHEALTYFYFLHEYPHIAQVDPNDCITLVDKYSSSVKPKVLKSLYDSTATIVPKIKEKLDQKYSSYNIESIELVPDSYIADKLNTGDIQLILKHRDLYKVENISLKALAKSSNKVTTKNPGIGSILGPTYFNVGSLEHFVSEVKLKFEIGELSHEESLESLADELGLQLTGATQPQLKQGIENLLGKCMMAITFYEENTSYCKEPTMINGSIKLFRKKPTAIQNTLSWNNNMEEISLRVKFSRGKQHGWSSIKLTSEYQVLLKKK